LRESFLNLSRLLFAGEDAADIQIDDLVAPFGD
jgi:hypothetical protein